MFENLAIVFSLAMFCALTVVAEPLPAKEGGALRLLTYNVRNGNGMDKQHDLGRIVKVLKDVDADAVALQELDWFTKRHNIPVISNLAERVGVHYVYGPAIDHQGGQYGVGVLSKERPLAHRQIPLPGREKRTFLIVEFEKYIFCCTHFALQETNRLASVKLITAAIGDSKKPLFLLGDLNAQPTNELHKELGKNFTLLSGTTEGTYPADKPTVCIDYIYGLNSSGTYKVLGTKVIPEPMASDHRPVYVDVDVGGL